MSSYRHPKTRTNDLVIQQIGEEILIYDERRHLAFCLDRVAAAVWNHCDGGQSVPQLATMLTEELAQPMTEDAVLFALAQLEEDCLLERESQEHAEASFVALSLVSRRSLIARLGASAALMLPVVAVIAAPKAAQAYSGCVDCSAAPASQRSDGLEPSGEPGEPSNTRSSENKTDQLSGDPE
jgi:hypothetical protein